jgi:hypothetical protein
MDAITVRLRSAASLASMDLLTFGIGHVVYDEQEQERIVRDVIKEWISKFNETENFENITFLSSELARYAMVLKNPAFVEEKEWRMVYLAHEEDLNASGEREALKPYNLFHDLRFRTRRDALIPYYDVKFNEFGQGYPIKEVVLGPKNKTLSYDIELMLKFCGMNNVVVHASNIPYR